jgi:putative membrane protein insertion efficiency factor
LVTLGLLLCGIWQRVFSPFVGARCRYYPSCSQYTAEALREFGFIRGAAKGIIRILRCNSLFPGGYEPVKKPVKKCDSAEIGV